MAAAPICFVACVESGPLEAQTVRLVESLRRFGGSLAGADVLAVTARFGPPLARSTRRHFAELGVRHERVPSHPRYAWYHYLNKPLALAAAEELTEAPVLAWLDSDILVLGEPTGLALDVRSDFAACAPDIGVVGSTGQGSPHDPDWRRLCALFGLEADDLPWIVTESERERIRLYFNSGVFSYRRGTGFSAAYLDACLRVLDARFGFAHNGEHFTDQLVLGIVMLGAGLRWRALPHAYNFGTASFLAPPDPDALAAVRLLHYHDAMQPSFWSALLASLREPHPEAHAWLTAREPLGDPAPPPWRAVRQGLRVARGLPRRRYRLAGAA